MLYIFYGPQSLKYLLSESDSKSLHSISNTPWHLGVSANSKLRWIVGPLIFHVSKDMISIVFGYGCF